VVYVIENNQYAMGTAVSRAAAETEFHRHGESYGIPGIACDGMDVLAVRDAALEAVSFVRAGNGPMILEMKTYRYRGHSMSDPAKYRTKEEVQGMRESRDPIEQMKRRLVDDHGVDEADLKAVDKEVRAIVAEAAEFAQASPEPDPATLATDIMREG
jgi:pyruvate dehydrogenase E1 component alpha subunit